MRTTSDLEYSNNNGIMAIRPSRTGRLKGLVATTAEGVERVWIFNNPHTYTDGDGDERIDHHMRGVACGSYSDGQQFLKRCRKLGLTVQFVGFYVPFSNGQRSTGELEDPNKGDHLASDYCIDELKMMRWNLPSPEQLARMSNTVRER